MLFYSSLSLSDLTNAYTWKNLCIVMWQKILSYPFMRFCIVTIYDYYLKIPGWNICILSVTKS